ncbi:MAG: hypothetical protein JJT88_11030 [Gammaproteobacteria bacterium]|nr:hypothetical protein [Gammaproteobacteria bacterium]
MQRPDEFVRQEQALGTRPGRILLVAAASDTAEELLHLKPRNPGFEILVTLEMVQIEAVGIDVAGRSNATPESVPARRA